MTQIHETAEEYPTNGKLQFFLVDRRVGKTRVICLRKGMLFSVMVFFPLLSSIFYLGAQYGSRHVGQDNRLTFGLQVPSLTELSLEPPVENQIDALALRLGQLQSQMLRLNVIGQRMIEELDIAEDEFELLQIPAMGGSGIDPFEESQSYDDLMKQVETVSIQMYDQEIQLKTFSELLTARELRMETMPAGAPVKNGWLTSSYGWRTDPFSGKHTFHSGVDFAAKQGTEVMAVASGLVIWASWDGGYGNMVAIDHGDGYVTRYAHNRDLLVVAGDRVNKGETIAHMGSTGHSTGSHVHFEVLRNGNKINPRKFIQQTG